MELVNYLYLFKIRDSILAVKMYIRNLFLCALPTVSAKSLHTQPIYIYCFHFFQILTIPKINERDFRAFLMKATVSRHKWINLGFPTDANRVKISKREMKMICGTLGMLGRIQGRLLICPSRAVHSFSQILVRPELQHL
jgi:hypothetical protein